MLGSERRRFGITGGIGRAGSRQCVGGIVGFGKSYSPQGVNNAKGDSMARGRPRKAVTDADRISVPVETNLEDVERVAIEGSMNSAPEPDLTRIYPNALPDDIIVLSRRDKNTMEYATIGRVAFDATTDDIGDKYGGGDFRALLRGISRVTGKKAGLGKRDFFIEGEPKKERAAESDDSGDAPSRSQRREDLYDQALSNLISQQADNSKMVVGLVAQMMGSMHRDPVPAGPTLAETMAAVAAIIAAVKPAGGDVMTPEKMFTMFAQLQQITGTKPPTETKSGMAALKDMLEVRDLLKGEGGGEDGDGPAGWLDVVRDFAPAIKEAIGNASRVDATRRAVPVPDGGPVNIIAQFTAAIPMLVEAASNNEEPAAVAVNILGSAGQMVGPLTAAVADPQFTDKFLAAHPQLSPWRPWVENVIAELRARRGIPAGPVKARPTL